MCVAEILDNPAEAHTASNWQSQDSNLSPLRKKACVIRWEACASDHRDQTGMESAPLSLIGMFFFFYQMNQLFCSECRRNEKPMLLFAV